MPEYWEESWRLEDTCCHSNSSERPSANADVKNSNGDNHNNCRQKKQQKLGNKWENSSIRRFQPSKIANENTVIGIWLGNEERETESYLMAVQKYHKNQLRWNKNLYELTEL